jgi:hypothetical protein
MHSLLAVVDSSTPSVYLMFGFILFFGSTLARRLTATPASKVAIAGTHRGVDELNLANVVSIDRSTREPKTPRLAERRVS